VDAAEHFEAQAKVLLDDEKGRRFLPTVQGLLIMFAYSIAMGKDRAGLIFRHTAYDMLNRLRLEDGFFGVNNTKYDYKERRAYSRALWGIYCFER
jgi:hypothetical protein